MSGREAPRARMIGTGRPPPWAPAPGPLGSAQPSGTWVLLRWSVLRLLRACRAAWGIFAGMQRTTFGTLAPEKACQLGKAHSQCSRWACELICGVGGVPPIRRLSRASDIQRVKPILRPRWSWRRVVRCHGLLPLGMVGRSRHDGGCPPCGATTSRPDNRMDDRAGGAEFAAKRQLASDILLRTVGRASLGASSAPILGAQANTYRARRVPGSGPWRPARRSVRRFHRLRVDVADHRC